MMQHTIRDAVTAALTTLGIDQVDFAVEHPADVAHGDYAVNVALVAAKQVGENPRALAEQIVEALQAQNLEQVADITIAGPGFINFTLERSFFTDQVKAITAAGAAWGQNDTQAGEVVMVEYTSPNLFKPLHVGNLVGNIIGESFTRLFENAGADVRRMNYPSDIGLPVAKAVWGLKATNSDPTDIVALGEAYRFANEAYEKDGAEKDEIVAINQTLYAGTDPELTALREAGIKTSQDRIQELCTILGTHFDTQIFESEAAGPGADIVRAHIGDVFKESDGAIVYQGEKVGLHTRVFLNSKGLPTYEAKDIGHYTLKDAAQPDWTQSIIVTGGEQAEYFKVVYAAIRELFPAAAEKQLEHVPTGFLTLTTGKMSSRQGNVLTGESLLEAMQQAAHERAVESRTDDIAVLTKQVAVAALKYEILRHGVGSNIVFDKAKALSFEGDSGPYLQYTYARINSALAKAAERGITPDSSVAPTVVYPLERLLYRFPEVAEEALRERAPQKVAHFLSELAGAFNTFYATEKIADPDDQYAPYKAAVAAAVGQTLKNGLWMLGIEAPEKM